MKPVYSTLAVTETCYPSHSNKDHIHQRRTVASRALGTLLLSGLLWAGPTTTSADPGPLDCSKKSLSDAITKADNAEQTIQFTGVCAGPIVISKDGVTLGDFLE